VNRGRFALGLEGRDGLRYIILCHNGPFGNGQPSSGAWQKYSYRWGVVL
jgi:hypothetical protein